MNPILQRMQFLGKCLALGMPIAWVAWLVPFDDLVDRSGAALGGDYVMLYIAGRAVIQGESATLYDDGLNQQRTGSVLPGMDRRASWPYRYPPFVAWAMVPLAALPYGWSYLGFFSLSAAVWAVSLAALTRSLTLEANQRRAILWAAVGWPVAIEVLIGGQSSMMALGILVAAMALLRSRRQVLAGMVLGLAAYKPNILALLAIGVFVRYPRALVGAVGTGVCLLAVSYAAVGFDGIWEYVHLATSLSTGAWNLETPYWKVHGLTAWVAPIAGENARAVTTGLGVVTAVLISVWAARKRVPWGCWLSALVVVNTLFNPYAPIYDLVLLFPAVIWWFAGQDRQSLAAGSSLPAQLVVLALYFGPHLSQAVCKSLQTDLQLFAVVLCGVLAWQLRGGWRQCELRAALA